MKFRRDFVTNSSSSSYICEISGEIVTCYDGEELEDSGMRECIYGHCYMNSYASKVSLTHVLDEMLKRTKEKIEEYELDIKNNEMDRDSVNRYHNCLIVCKVILRIIEYYYKSVKNDTYDKSRYNTLEDIDISEVFNVLNDTYAYMCQEEILTPEETDDLSGDDFEYIFCDYILDGCNKYSLSCLCPICNFEKISTFQLNDFKNIMLGLTNEQLEKQLIGYFKNYEEFNEFVRDNKSKLNHRNDEGDDIPF